MSGIGYAIWYAVLPVLRATTAATLQLTVPVIAALGGVLFLSEQFNWAGRLASLMSWWRLAFVCDDRANPCFCSLHVGDHSTQIEPFRKSGRKGMIRPLKDSLDDADLPARVARA